MEQTNNNIGQKRRIDTRNAGRGRPQDIPEWRKKLYESWYKVLSLGKYKRCADCKSAAVPSKESPCAGCLAGQRAKRNAAEAKRKAAMAKAAGPAQ